MATRKALDAAYRIVTEHAWGWEENALDDLTPDQQEHMEMLAAELDRFAAEQAAAVTSAFKQYREVQKTGQSVFIKPSGRNGGTAWGELIEAIEALSDDKAVRIKPMTRDEMINAPINEEPSADAMTDAKHVANLVMLVARLVQQVRKHDKDNDVAEKAMDYLRRSDLQPSILRGTTEHAMSNGRQIKHKTP